MSSKELAEQIINSCTDMDWTDYAELYEKETKKLTADIELAKEIGLDYLIKAVEKLVL